MRTILFFILISLLNSCYTEKNDKTFIPSEYQYPEDSILKGKTFIYQKVGTTEKNHTDFMLKFIDNKKYLISVQYSAGKIEDSVIALKDKVKEMYSFSFDDGMPLRALIVQDTIINNGSKFGKRVKRTIFRTNDYTSDNTSELEYLKDTTFSWKSKQIDCIVMKGISTTQLISHTSDSSRQELTSYHNLYYGKNIGLLKYSTNFNDEHYVYELTNITGKN